MHALHPHRSSTALLPLAALGLAVACAKPLPDPQQARASTEIDLTRPARDRPAWPPGLLPCAKDAPEGTSCGAAPPPAAGASAGGTKAAPVDDPTVWKVPVGPDDPSRGPADALVTLVVFSDFECPFCKKTTPTFERILSEHARDVRLVWKDLPLPMHEHAEAAAELARAARAAKGDPGFWAAHDLLYAAQPDLGEGALHRIADKLGLPWGPTWASVRAARFGAVIRADSALSDRVDVQATPTTFVNGRKLVGAQPYDRTSALVDAELEKAKRLVAAGTAPSAVYARIIAQGTEVPVPADVPAP
jgi:protein-disulfide isomerase